MCLYIQDLGSISSMKGGREGGKEGRRMGGREGRRKKGKEEVEGGRERKYENTNQK